MEINGIVNIKTQIISLVQLLKQEVTSQDMGDQVDDILLKVERELDFLERYMIAYHDAMQKNLKNTQYYGTIYMRVPYWHEVKADFLKYPLLRDKMAKEFFRK